MGVVVVDAVGHELFELVLVPDEGSVEELATNGPDPPFSKRVGDWCADRGLKDAEAFGSEDLIERANELATSITNQGPVIL